MEYCSRCGNEMEGKFCGKCGMPSIKIVMEESQKSNIESKDWFVILMLIFVFPVGLFLMWKNKVFSKALRIIFTIFESIFISLALVVIVFLAIEFGFKNGAAGKSFGDKYISMVKKGCPQAYMGEGVSYEEAFDLYFYDSNWEYFESDDGDYVVEFTGTHFENRHVDFLIQFVIEDIGEFRCNWIEVDGVGWYSYEIDYYLQEIFDYAIEMEK